MLWLFVAGLVHALVILGVTFVEPEHTPERANTLDVVLVQSRSDTAPEEAQYVAQANQDGGGDVETPTRPAAPLPAPLSSPVAEVVSASPPPRDAAAPRDAAVPEPEPSAPATAVLSSEVTASADEVRPLPPKPRPRPRQLRQVRAAPAPAAPATPPKPRIDARTLVTQSLAYASLSAEVDQRLNRYASKPRHKWITARTRESKYAAYMEAWRSKVERVGNLNYPDAARRERLAGTLLLDVAINADGTVSEVELRRSSGHRVLDDAAIRIVKLAAPFAPLPAGIRRETDVLHIERTWQFLSSNRLSSR